jgi:hypothetical protein
VLRNGNPSSNHRKSTERTEIERACHARSKASRPLQRPENRHSSQVIITGESPEEFEAFAAALRDTWNPADLVESAFVDRLIHNSWRLDRLRLAEARIWDRAVASSPPPTPTRQHRALPQPSHRRSRTPPGRPCQSRCPTPVAANPSDETKPIVPGREGGNTRSLDQGDF